MTKPVPKRKVLDPNGPYINMGQTKMRNVCRMFCNSICFGYCLCKGLECSLKIPYFILDYPDVTGFLIFETVFRLLDQYV